MNKVVFAGYKDGPYEINMCLHCERKECINCLSQWKSHLGKQRVRDPEGKYHLRKVVVCYNDNNRAILETYDCVEDCAKAYNLQCSYIYKSCIDKRVPKKSYIYLGLPEMRKNEII